MARIRADYVFGSIDAALAAGDTSLSSPALARLPVVSGGDVAAVTLHDSETGAYEIVHVTSHAAAATTATILRGREGSTARAWVSGAAWDHGATAMDMTLMGDLFRGEWAAPTATVADYGFQSEISADFALSKTGDAAVLPALSTVAASGVSGTPDGWTGAVALANVDVHESNVSILTLDLATLGIEGITKVRSWIGRTGGSNSQYTQTRVRKNGVDVANLGGQQAWQLVEFDATSTDVIAWHGAGGHAAVGGGTSSTAYVTGVEIVASTTVDPYSAGEYVIHNRRVWRSDSADNVDEPSVSGWTAVPVGELPAGGVAGQVLAKASSTDYDVTWSTPSGGTGGSAWTALADYLPMTTLTGWEAKSGTWSLGAFGVQQTDTTLPNAYLTFETNVPLSGAAMRATVRFPTGAGGAYSAGFQMFSNDAAVANPAWSVWLVKDGSIKWDRFGSGGGSFSTGLTIAVDTDYTFGVVRRGMVADVYVNGVYYVSVTSDTGNNWQRNRVGLETRAGAAWFRNVAIWVPTTPW